MWTASSFPPLSFPLLWLFYICLMFSIWAPQLHNAGMWLLSGFIFAPFSLTSAFSAAMYLCFSSFDFFSSSLYSSVTVLSRIHWFSRSRIACCSSFSIFFGLYLSTAWKFLPSRNLYSIENWYAAFRMVPSDSNSDL